MNPSPPIPEKTDGARLASYVLVAVAALLAGLILGSLSAPAGSDSRVGWPASTNPRALSP